jgi:hypothetical protein
MWPQINMKKVIKGKLMNKGEGVTIITRKGMALRIIFR